jgi:hypothetical protein
MDTPGDVSGVTRLVSRECVRVARGSTMGELQEIAEREEQKTNASIGKELLPHACQPYAEQSRQAEARQLDRLLPPHAASR